MDAKADEADIDVYAAPSGGGDALRVTTSKKPETSPRFSPDGRYLAFLSGRDGKKGQLWLLEVYGRTGQALTVRREAERLRLEGKDEEEVRSPPIDPPEDDPLRYLAAVVRGEVRPSGLSSLENNLVVTEILDAARSRPRADGPSGCAEAAAAWDSGKTITGGTAHPRRCPTMPPSGGEGMRKVLLFGLAGWLWLGAPSDARCDGLERRPEDVGFASVGLGAGSRAMAGVASLNFSHRDLLYGLRASTVSEFNIFGPAPDESDTDYALLVGKCSHGHHRFASAATGIGLVRSVRRGRLVHPPGWFFGGEYERLDRTTVGLPLDVKASLNASAVGIGLNLFGNLNTRGNFAGVALTLQLGRFP